MAARQMANLRSVTALVFSDLDSYSVGEKCYFSPIIHPTPPGSYDPKIDGKCVGWWSFSFARRLSMFQIMLKVILLRRSLQFFKKYSNV